VVRRARMDTVVKRKIPCPYRESKPRRSVRSIVSTPTELSGRGDTGEKNGKLVMMSCKQNVFIAVPLH
jgi:hypothetical protein